MRAIAHRLLRASFYLVPGIVLSLLVARAGASACPEDDREALAWLDKMSRSLNQVSYHGVVTFQRGDDLQAMQISHTVADGLASERLVELTGQGAEVLRIDHPLECIHPGHRLLRLGAELQFSADRWEAELRLTEVAKQDRPGEFEANTDSYTRLDVRLNYRVNRDGLDYLIFLKGSNLLDEEIRNATSFLRNAAPDAGRGLQLGVCMSF